MPSPSRVDRLGLVTALDQLVTSGATVDEITDALNQALARADRPDRLSRAAVGRARKTRLGVLEAKRHADDVLHTLADAGSAAGLEGRLELMRMLLTSTAARMTDDPEAPPPDPHELRALATAFFAVEKTGHLADQRDAAAEARARTQAATRGEQAARSQGLSPAASAAIRAAIEGADEDTPPS